MALARIILHPRCPDSWRRDAQVTSVSAYRSGRFAEPRDIAWYDILGHETRRSAEFRSRVYTSRNETGVLSDNSYY